MSPTPILTMPTSNSIQSHSILVNETKILIFLKYQSKEYLKCFSFLSNPVLGSVRGRREEDTVLPSRSL